MVDFELYGWILWLFFRGVGGGYARRPQAWNDRPQSGQITGALCWRLFEEKVGVGSVGQYDCLKKSIVSLYPNNDKVSVDSIIELLQKQHLNPPTDQEENEDVKDMSEEDHIFDADAPF